MGNSSSQEEEGHRHHRSKEAREHPPAKEHDRIPAVPPQGFEQRLPIGSKVDIATTSVTKESATVTPPGNSGSSFHHEEFSHVETVEQAPGTTTGSSAGASTSGSGAQSSASSTTSAAPLRPGILRRKSTILLEDPADDDMEISKLKLTSEMTPLSRANSGEEIELSNRSEVDEKRYDTVIEWNQGGHKVYVTGSFTGWRRMLKLTRMDDGVFSTVLKLPKGTHRMRFVVDNEERCSDTLPAATDSMGNLVNYLEVGDPADLTREPAGDDPVGDDGRYERFEEGVSGDPILEYGREVPAVFTDAEAMDRFVSSDFVTPPSLPPHLEGVILNSNSTEKDNNSILPIPNHVVLNHLATTSIKHNVLAVAFISRYSRKYVTQILYAPL